ncbi:hypothetical protein GCM10007301_03070 [Azorhizobium oxalatiphilum]|uniref:Uncharacterized protein n=1 Tax=Azorhizobium oxalatiphilum TaxID=980631 RepID=A0A917BKP5_9HYPH|nr:hypothetical protein GCM10007301_03070 [Azorhizobium oxalatiphilum]
MVHTITVSTAPRIPRRVEVRRTEPPVWEVALAGVAGAVIECLFGAQATRMMRSPVRVPVGAAARKSKVSNIALFSGTRHLQIALPLLSLVTRGPANRRQRLVTEERG